VKGFSFARRKAVTLPENLALTFENLALTFSKKALTFFRQATAFEKQTVAFAQIFCGIVSS